MKNLKSLLLLPLLVTLTTVTADARKTKKPKVPEIFQVEILRCHDGDTCTGLRLPKAPEQQKIKIRFAGIDAPEAKQKFGAEARDFLETQIKGKQVRIECEGQSYDRRTCQVYQGEASINALMVKEGWAWDSPKYSKGTYSQAQTEATAAKKGMWVEAPGKSPFCFRHKENARCRSSQIFNP